MIIVGVDGSAHSLEALRWAARQAKLTGDQLTVVAAWEWPMSFGAAPVFPDDFDPAAVAEKVLADAVEGLEAEHRGVDVTTRAVQGPPAPALIEASEDAALLVVGSRGHGEFVGMLLGSVSEHCATHAHCPVVVVRNQAPPTTAG